jgi:hypothetical protein
VKEHGLLFISIDMVAPILHQVVELLGVLIDRMIPLAQIQKLSKLAVHYAHRQVVAMKGSAEHTPWHMVICWQCGSV